MTSQKKLYFRALRVSESTLCIRQGKICPKSVQFNVRDKEQLPIFVNGPFRDIINRTDPNCFFAVVWQGIGSIPKSLSDINCLAVTRLLDICAAALYGVQLFLLAFLARVPFYDK